MPQNTQQLPSERNQDIEMIEEIKHSPSIVSISEVPFNSKNSNYNSDKGDVPGTSNLRSLLNNSPGSSRLKEPSKLLTFRVHYLSNVYNINLSEKSLLGIFTSY